MDANGVDRAVLVQTSWSTWDNGYVADSARRHASRLVAIGMVDPLDRDNARTAAHWMDDRGMAGFRFHPAYYHPPEGQTTTPGLTRVGHPYGADILTLPQNAALWEALDARRAVVQIHCRPNDAHQLDSVAARYRRVTWLIDHMMYPLPDWAPRFEPYAPVLALARHPNVLIKVSDVHGRSKQPYPYRDMHGVVREIVRAFGVERCMWGTGYPGHHRQKAKWPSLADELRLVREGFDFLNDGDRRKVLGENAARVWKWAVP
jgi:predicted TIM-barrel fold metal-dependent hydrolase